MCDRNRWRRFTLYLFVTIRKLALFFFRCKHFDIAMRLFVLARTLLNINREHNEFICCDTVTTPQHGIFDIFSITVVHIPWISLLQRNGITCNLLYPPRIYVYCHNWCQWRARHGICAAVNLDSILKDAHENSCTKNLVPYWKSNTFCPSGIYFWKILCSFLIVYLKRLYASLFLCSVFYIQTVNLILMHRYMIMYMNIMFGATKCIFQSSV